MTGFDPSRISELLEGADVQFLQPIIRKAADDFYCQVLDAVNDYLLENLDHNLKSHLAMLERTNQQMRTELWEIDRALGERPVADRKAAIERLDTTSRRYFELLMEVSHKFEGESRHETALRYIRARDRDGSGEAGQTAQQAGPEGQQPGPEASPK